MSLCSSMRPEDVIVPPAAEVAARLIESADRKFTPAAWAGAISIFIEETLSGAQSFQSPPAGPVCFC
jgi:hypothetical protein